MHKGIILLVKAKTAEDAVDQAASKIADWAENNTAGVDWGVVGGRWSGLLNRVHSDYMTASKKKFFGKKDFISTKDIEDNADGLQSLWLSMGGKGENPYNRDDYSPRGLTDDVAPYLDAREIVDDWEDSQVKRTEEFMDEFKNRCSKLKIDKVSQFDSSVFKKDTMLGYYFKCAYDLERGDFTSDVNVYDIDAECSSSRFIKKGEEKDYFAVIIDVHT